VKIGSLKKYEEDIAAINKKMTRVKKLALGFNCNYPITIKLI